MTKDELIAALEKATGPSKELDGDIEHFLQPLGHRLKMYPGLYQHAHDRSHVIPAYTSSIDAALTLVPADRWPGVQQLPGAWEVTLDICDGDEVDMDVRVIVEAPTAPLALCIAALRARPAPEATGVLPKSDHEVAPKGSD